MKNDNKTLYILLGIGAGIGVYYFLCNRWKNKQQQFFNQSQEIIEK